MEDNIVQKSCCGNLSRVIVGSIELFFYRYGRLVATHPWRCVAACLALAALSTAGLLRFHQERRPLRLWIPPASDFARDTAWLLTQFRESYRLQALLVTAPDVLQPRVLRQLAEVHQRVLQVSADGVTWEDVCFRIPVIDIHLHSRPGGDGNGSAAGADDWLAEGFDPSVMLPSSLYCQIVNNLEKGCLASSLLELWKYDVSEVGNLTHDRIVAALDTRFSPVLGHPANFTRLLGGVERDSEGNIVSASAVLSLYFVHINLSSYNMDDGGNDMGTGDGATPAILAWEKEFLEVMGEAAKNVQGMNLYYEAGRSYGDISAAAMFQDMDKLIVGVVLMFIYVQVILSKFNMVEFRVLLASAGLLCVGLAFAMACGLCSLAGVSYGPVHTALPFLLLGIGVDDMFVLMAGWRRLSRAERQMPLPEKMGRMLQHAGTSITITSLTDVVAFLVGASTILPSLQSFCLYAAVGVLVTYVLQSTLFVACFVLDERRVQESRNSVLFCIKHHDYKPNACSQISYSKKILNKIYSTTILTVPGQVLVLLTTVGLAAVSIKGNLELRQKFDPIWFLSESTHLYRFIEERSHYYPDVGKDAGVYLGRLNYSLELPRISQLISTFKQQTEILKDVEDWYSGFEKYVGKHYDYNLTEQHLSEEDFNDLLSRYLYSPSGASYQKNFRFDGELECGVPVPPITMSSFDFKFKLFHGPEESLPAMNRVKRLVREANFTTGDRFATVWGKIFANWVTDEVIDTELYRNLILACLCVMLCTAILIVNFVTCLFVFICVLLTLMNVAGMMYFWGLTIDIVSCVGLELAAGLCVDYAAHIGHTFLTCGGTRRERALRTVEDIGPAVLSGGTATLLALAVLASSESYIFVSFFKIFLLVVLFGLFHGLIFLPAVLSLVGPDPYPTMHGWNAQLQGEKLYGLCDSAAQGKEKSGCIQEPS